MLKLLANIQCDDLMLNVALHPICLSRPTSPLVIGTVMALSVAWLAILWLTNNTGMTTVDSRASHTRLVANARVMTVACVCSSQLSIACIVTLRSLVALPEWSTAPLRVVVRWGWTVSLLLLVMVDKQDVPCGRDEEE